ncbi:subtilisin-like protease SBT3.3 [Durio zibethinus]|uniref:Subtilisin-like protease SBT3.3 n=1 Tax=Durio zibethinus TaxID=66656 RepID=A0A6P5Y7F4_DURZI|nr:subtilisin-like protease SBT3.3 [Durio zibethinus]
MLATVLGSEETSKDSMVYSYKHGFSGFAAKMTEAQAQKLSKLPGVVHVTRNRFYKPQTTRSWDYLGLSSSSPSNLLNKSKMGNGVIIGLLDTGIWPESEVFSDEGLGPIPSRWKGVCESGEHFDGAKACNRKLIGARYFISGLEAEYGQPYNSSENDDYMSPRDPGGHGTHTSSTAGGSFVDNVSYYGLGPGTVRGGAPGARLAMYKVCWRLDGGVCADADVLKAFDEAIHDGVDVLSVSLVADIPLYSEVDQRGSIPIGSFHAVAKGITVVCAAGNAGPRAQTVQNTSPWILTVAASSLDRSFPTPIMLGNNQSIMGQAMFTGEDTVFATLVYPEVSDLMVSRNCESLSSNDDWMAEKVVLCFASDYNQSLLDKGIWSVKEAGGLGVIIVRSSSDYFYSYATDFPCVQVTYETGTQILYYIRSTSNPQVRLSPSRTHIGKPVSTNVAYFSSRGPSSNAPAILKPDIAAPGVKILAAIPPFDQPTNEAYAFLSGTSMATPHVSGIVALLKSLHQDWSPAAVKSAIVTTAMTADQSGGPIFAEGEPPKLADPFDFGGGIVNPNRAADPGLVYDMDTEDYIKYLCAMGYNDSAIFQLTEHEIACPAKQPSILDVNLPSITIPSLRKTTTLTRTVTNVGPLNSKYKANVEFVSGINITVRPETLIFNSKTKTISFSVMISSAFNVNAGYYFGSLTWTDGVYVVRSPISVRTEVGSSSF